MNYWIYLIIAFLIFDLLVVIFIFKKSRRKFSKKKLNFIHAQWQKIINLSAKDPKQSILEADKLLDYCLNLKGYQGSLGEKLKKTGSLFSNLNNVWSAHKLRNQIAHELNFNLHPRDLQFALSTFKKALIDLGIPL